VKLYVTTTVVLLSCLSALPARAADRPQITYGPSAGYLWSAGPTVGVDVTWIPCEWETWWLSGGVRGALPKEHALVLPYVEAGGLFLLNLGVGATMASGGGHGTSALGHLFLGLPIGNDKNRDTFYIEPYYRPAYGTMLGQTGFQHEVGLLVKWGYIRERKLMGF
jgi:hypothetical protein